MICDICPRRCRVDRAKTTRFCQETEEIRISKVMLHKYEEPLISGGEKDKGSGAIFFAGCNLKCVYCQNFPISHKNKGKNISVAELADTFKDLKRRGALNINLVTPTHFTMQIIEALKIYKPNIPIVWNSSGYESVETIEKLKGYVDIFLVDLKYMSNELSTKYSGAVDYAEVATKAILKMRALQPRDMIEKGHMKKGIIVRHLVLPTHTDDSIKCLDFILKNLGKDTIVSIMSQYEPRYDAKKFHEIDRKITPIEYKRVVNFALKNDMKNCFVQDLSSADSKYTPKF